MLMTTMFAVINEGQAAHGYGLSVDKCPYELGSPDARAWKIGWHRSFQAAIELRQSLKAVEESKKPDAQA
jgi:hypothetical protein